MILLASKLFGTVFYPVGLACLLAVTAIVALCFRKIKTSIICICLSMLIIWFFSTPFVSHALMISLESRFGQPAQYPKASAIVLLGGVTRPAVAPRRYVEINAGGNRILHAARLLKAGYAPVIICTGGKIPFLHDFPGSEAECMAAVLSELLGVDSSSIIIEKKAQNTHDHGPKIKEICEKMNLKKEIILVTSAMHMYRSVKVFRKYGFMVFPAPTDFWCEKKSHWNLFSIFPSSDALFTSTIAIHEYYGLVAYKMMGWL